MENVESVVPPTRFNEMFDGVPAVDVKQIKSIVVTHFGVLEANEQRQYHPEKRMSIVMECRDVNGKRVGVVTHCLPIIG